MPPTIEDAILTADTRGMMRLRPSLPADFCLRAARALLGARARVLVVSGFHVVGRGETDGPPGAVAIARALRALGGEAVLVGDGHAAQVLAGLDETVAVSPEAFLAGDGTARVIDFPLLPPAESDALCARLIDEYKPTAVVAVERCGRTADSTYRNMRGEDICAVTACLDGLFDTADGSHETIGVGDGGNEIGMGSLADVIVAEQVTGWPCLTPVRFPVIASVSNWGAYGLCAGLSMEAGRALLPDEETATRDLARVIELGGLDGVTRQPTVSVDGRTAEENAAILRNLHAIVHAHLQP